MGKEHLTASPERLALGKIVTTLQDVQENWSSIETDLHRHGLGKRDVPFNTVIRDRMIEGYTYLDELLAQRIEPFSAKNLGKLLILNEIVHYGHDMSLREEYSSAIGENAKKFYSHIEPIKDWYSRHKKRGDKPQKIAAEIYVSILGYPQLFVEGNHRTGALIASWVNMYHGHPPFVLSEENAVAYFQPSDAIKHFADKTTWRGKTKLPKYRKSFTEYWEAATDRKYMASA